MATKYPQTLKERAESYGLFIVENGATVREAAKKFGVSKSLIHRNVTEVLSYSNGRLAREVRKVLDKNKAERHIRGGMATKLKYKKAK